MNSDTSTFQPLRPRRLVAARPDVGIGGPGTRFTTGQLVEEPEDPTGVVLQLVLQLAARSR